MPDGNPGSSTYHVIQSDTVVVWLSIVLLLAFWLSAYGWGRLFASYVRVPLLRLHSVCIVAGLGLLNVLGGWLNLVKLAVTPCLMALMIGGGLFAIIDLIRRKPWSRRSGRDEQTMIETPQTPRRFVVALPLLVAAVLTLGAAALLIKPLVFNDYDDFITYVTRGVRMAQTGTLAGNPFETLGTDSLGGQSFFQGFFLANRDVRMMHVFDAVACFGLALFLMAELAMWWRLPAAVGVLAVLMTAAINPQAVNVSSLYSGVVAGLALAVAGAVLAPRLRISRKRPGHEVLLALIAALLVTLKVTSAFFAALYLVALYLAALLAGTPLKSLAKSAVTVMVASIAFVAPWLALHLPTYAGARAAAAPFAEHASIAGKYPSLAAHDIPKLFSTSSLYWGDSIGAYNFVAVICLAAAVVAGLAARRKIGRARTRAWLSLVAVSVAALGTCLLNAEFFSIGNAIRYSCPTLIAASVMSVMLLLKFSRAAGGGFHRRAVLAGCVVMAATVVLFGKTFYARIHRASESRTLIVFPVGEDYKDYCAWALSERPARYVQRVQARMEPGATALVWATTPFHLNFSRNRLLVVSEAGIINPATAFPAGIGADELRQYLQRLGIRYAWLQLPGTGIKTVGTWKPQLQSEDLINRKLADYSIYFLETLGAVMAQSKTVYQDKGSVLVDLREPATTAEAASDAKSPPR